MNKDKIKLIADRATVWCQQYARGNPEAWEWEYKFAELIINECAGIYEAIDNGNMVEGTDNYIQALRRRFDL